MKTIQLVGVKRADHDTPCRRCGQDITRGRRVALVFGIGGICLRCWLSTRSNHYPQGERHDHD